VPAPTGPPPTFANPVAYQAVPQQSRAALTDVNGDGILDIMATSDTARDFVTMLGVGDGTFQPALHNPPNPAVTNSTVPTITQMLVAGDFNNDGHPDAAGNDSLPPGGDTHLHYGVLLGVGDGTYRPMIRDTDPNTLMLTDTADLNRDGKLDLIGLAYSAATGLTPAMPVGLGVAFGHGDGTFDNLVSYATTSIPTSVAPGMNDAHLADFNGDGLLDVAAINANPQTVVYLNQGGGVFGPAQALPLGPRDQPDSMAVGDVNGDGQPDIAVIHGSFGTIEVFYNMGGTFPGGFTMTSVPNPRGIAIADVTRDGMPDVLVNSFSTKTVQLFVGAPAQAFANYSLTASATQYRDNGGAPSRLSVGDLNRDGRPDVVVPNDERGDTIDTVLLNKTP